MPVMPPDAVTIREAAQLLGLDEVTLSHLAEDRQIPAVRSEDRWLFSRKSLQKWQKLRGMGSPGRGDADGKK
jgi:excisionase family DNA binding protein